VTEQLFCAKTEKSEEADKNVIHFSIFGNSFFECRRDILKRASLQLRISAQLPSSELPRFRNRLELELELDASVNPSHPTDDIGEES